MNEAAGVNEKDRILMQLAHYFITVENYTPIVVRGVKNEIWLENLDAPYKIVRINTNYIHNNEQFNYDIFKIKNVVRQIKKKTFSFNMKTLNILVDVGNNVEKKEDEKIDCIFIDSEKGIKKSKEMNELYPEIKDNLLDGKTGIDFLMNITNDINKKTERESKEYEQIFKKKNINVTYILMIINIVVFILGLIGNITGKFDIYTLFALNREYIKTGQLHRLLTSMFLHQDIFHIMMNMYALYILGTQVETYFGKKKYLIIYILSGIFGGLLFCVVNPSWGLGASGAIFGLMGALLYFGYNYRLYLSSALKTEIIPLIILNLGLGLFISNIALSAHIGGLIGGVLFSMIVGLDKKENNQDRINGIICSIIICLFLMYMLFGIK